MAASCLSSIKGRLLICPVASVHRYYIDIIIIYKAYCYDGNIPSSI